MNNELERMIFSMPGYKAIQVGDKFKKIVKFAMPFDKRHSDPDKNYGIAAMRIYFILMKDQRAVQVIISTNCYLQSVVKEHRAKGTDLFFDDETFNCWDVGYHSPKPMFDSHKPTKCDLLKGDECYYDGSSLRGKTDNVGKNFELYGEQWIWEYLEEYWYEVFKD